MSLTHVDGLYTIEYAQREGGREGGKEKGNEGGKEGGREGGREGVELESYQSRTMYPNTLLEREREGG